MAFNVDDKVRVIDESSEYRGHRGVVKAVTDDNHQVRLDGHGCAGRVTLRTDQLATDALTHPTDYTQC